MRYRYLIGAVVVVSCASLQAQEPTYTNMPVQCVGISTDLEGKPMSSCPAGNQKFVRAQDESWVRSCPQDDTSVSNPTTCTYQTFVWTKWGSAKNSSGRFEVCTVAKKPNDPAAGTGASCTATGTTGFSAMKQVAPYDVAVVPPLPSGASFTVTPAQGAAPLNVKLAWNIAGMPGGTPCQAQSTGLTSNAAGPWSGPKSAVGTEDISSLMESTRFTLTCVYSKDIGVVVSWQKPTQNTDGSPATDINGFTVVYGQSPQALSQSANAAANVTSLLVQDFYFKADQTWYFAVKASNNGGNMSDQSNIASLKLVKPGGGSAPTSSSVTATVTGKTPFPPTGATTKQVDVPLNQTGQVEEKPQIEKRNMKTLSNAQLEAIIKGEPK